jgi:hypothetical protein
VVAVVLARQGAHPEEERLAIALGGLVLLLCSPLVWSHYFVLVLPMAILCLPRESRPGGPVIFLALCGLATQATRPLLSLLSAEGFWQEASLLNLGTALLFVAGLLELRGGKVESPP